jgi:hypothetical protein
LAYLPEVQAKLQRADELIEEIRQGLIPYLDSKNFFVETTQVEANVWELTVRMESQPPLKFGVMVGEVVHDLRSSLDGAMYQLLKTTYPIKFNDMSSRAKSKICFPVLDNEGEYTKRKWDSNLSDGTLVEDLIAVQPFRNLEFASNFGEKQLLLDTTPLRELHSLWNSDKHRQLHVLEGGLDMLALGLNADESAEWKMIDPPPWVDGSKPFQIVYKNGAPKEELNLTDSFAIGLPSDVRPLQVYPVIEKLKALRNHVEHYHSILAHWSATKGDSATA